MIDYISSSFSICKPSHFITEGHPEGQANFTLGKSTLSFSVTNSSSMCPEMFSKRIQSIIFPVTKVRLWCWHHHFGLFWRWVWCVSFSSLWRPLPISMNCERCYHLWKFSNCSQNPWMQPNDPIDLPEPSSVNWPLTQPSSTVGCSKPSSNPFTKNRALVDCWWSLMERRHQVPQS